MSVTNAMSAVGERVQQMIEADRRKIGGMTAGGMARQGLAELRQAVSLEGSVAAQTPTQLGVYGTLTPGEVSAARTDEVAAGEDREQAAADPVARAQQSASASGSTARGTGKGAGA